MDDGQCPRTERDAKSAGNSRLRVAVTLKPRATNAPARCLFFRFLSLDKQRKEV